MVHNTKSKTCKEEIERDITKKDYSMRLVMISYRRPNMKLGQSTPSKTCLHSETHQRNRTTLDIIATKEEKTKDKYDF